MSDWRKQMVHSIDSEIDEAAQYSLRVIRRERTHKPLSKKDLPDGTRCEQGCCEIRNGYWVCIA